ncbi:ABC transporter substrate-binding protein [Arhodomonas sp. SL1]|uniref:ABC transporter substrate-binding protein n=1 Tax=Arhodomonas sp. SL1 TaxID=3425691 RepID=UPI003F882A70
MNPLKPRTGMLKGGIAALSLLVGGVVQAQDSVTIGAMHDLTGGLNIYGIQQSQALHLAVKKLNEDGGVNGRTVEVVEYDTQSDDSKYTQYARTLNLRDNVVAMFGGLASSSREAVRPVARQSKVPYFYSALYEGGVCDRYTFLTGVTPSQQLGVMMEWAAEKYGDRFYVVAPDYNFGTISTHWVEQYAEEMGGEVVGTDFLPLSQSNFSSTLQKIQNTEPDVVVALPVGASQTSFYEQFAASGMKENIGIISTNYGSGNQQVVVSPEAGDGIYASQNYFMVVDTAKNEEFLELWREEYDGIDEPIISEANDTWNAVMLWAAAAEEAGTTEAEAVIDALEQGIAIDSPEGRVQMLPSHHLMHQVYLVRGDDNHSFEVIEQFEDVMPSYEQDVCNLVDNPEVSQQFTPQD